MSSPSTVPQPATSSALVLPELHDARDLDQFLTRAAGVRDGVARVVARGRVAAFHVAATFPIILGAKTPLFIAQRGLRLAAEAELDVVVPLSELRDRLARLSRQDDEGEQVLGVPPSRPSAPWTSLVPLGADWRAYGEVADDEWVAAARGVAARVQDSLPQDPGQPLVFAARDAVWATPLPELGEGVLSGAPFLAHALGFLQPGVSSRRFTARNWQRLSSRGGTLLWRPGT